MKSIAIRILVSSLLLSWTAVWLASCGEEGGSGTGPDAVPKPAPQLIGLQQTGASLHPLLVWHPVGTPADSVVYNLYFGRTNPPGLFAGSLSDTSYQSGPLMPNATYYWLIEARYDGGGTGSSAVSSFTTRAGITFPMVVGNQWEYRREATVSETSAVTRIAYYLVRVAAAAPGWPQQPAFAVSERWASLDLNIIDSAWSYYQQSAGGLYRLDSEDTSSAIPASVAAEGESYGFQGRRYSSVDDLFRSIGETPAAGSARPGSIAADQPVLGLKYPLEVGAKWTVYETDPWPLDKEVTDYSLVTVPGGTFGCFGVQWLYDKDTNGVYDANIQFVDYFAEQGLIKRAIFLDDVAVYDPLGNLIGVVDATEIYELVSCKLAE